MATPILIALYCQLLFDPSDQCTLPFHMFGHIVPSLTTSPPTHVFLHNHKLQSICAAPASLPADTGARRVYLDRFKVTQRARNLKTKKSVQADVLVCISAPISNFVGVRAPLSQSLLVIAVGGI